jgi:hypothetical protein
MAEGKTTRRGRGRVQIYNGKKEQHEGVLQSSIVDSKELATIDFLLQDSFFVKTD